MKKILFITYMFPPIAGSGIQRSLKFIKYLPEFGIEPVVFAPRNAQWKAFDPQNLKLPYLKKIKIYRCGINKLSRYYDLRFGRSQTKHPHFYFLILKYIWFIDFFSSWYFECRANALAIAKQEKVEAVFTSSPPHSIHLFGKYLQQHLGVPWVMDLRDAMYNDPNKSLSGFSIILNRLIEYVHETRFYRAATAITTVSQPILDSMVSRHPNIPLRQKSHLITNGFDDSDFDKVRSARPPKDRMSIIYTGAFLSQHTPEHFLQAVRSLISIGILNPDQILIKFIGYYSAQNKAVFKQFSNHVPIEVIPFQPHNRVLEYQSNADLLLLIVSLSAKEGGNQIYTGKFFEYLGAKRPIFALVPDGPLKRTIEEGRFGIVAAPKDIHDIANKFKILYKQWLRLRKLPYEGNLRIRSDFTRKKITKKLAQIIDGSYAGTQQKPILQ